MASPIIEGALAASRRSFTNLKNLIVALFEALVPVFKALYIGFWKIVNLFIEWHKLPGYISAFNLLALRYELRDNNLHDTYPAPEFQGTKKECPMQDTKFIASRHSDGLYNDLKQPRMGCVGMRFGRNVPRADAKQPSPEELLTPNPRVISERILARPEGQFQPATIVNLLAAAWIQFQVHEWAQHFLDNKKEAHINVPIGKGDRWPSKKMEIPRTKQAPVLDKTDLESPGYENQCTHWWDASQIYGSTEEETLALRASCEDNAPGQLKVTSSGGEEFLPRGTDGIPLTGFRQNWWIGLEILHTLFALEHNAIAKQLHISNPTWSSDQIFDTARLINAALMAKIHTVEWTPAILQHPALQIGMSANWWGLLGDKLWHVFGRIGDNKSEVLSGIPGSDVNHDGVPYSLTEEFVSVYRLHPLIPDNIAFFNVKNGKHESTLPMKDVVFESARKPFDAKTDSDSGSDSGLGLNFADVFYSFGVNYPGAIRARNMPNFLRDLVIPGDETFPEGRRLDLGTIDILRDRERGVPRYNAFRRLFHMPAVKTFTELTGGDAELAADLEDVYGGDVEAVDLLVGSLSEPLPEGFGFSDTAFRVFILMASRRIKSDRFLAGDGWCPEVYTREGMEWVQRNTMKDVLCRHFPELAAPLHDVKNAFAPWSKVGETENYMGVETNDPETLRQQSVSSKDE
ncbi:Alpha-dioxygenase 1 [Colletotrichum spinosum]|uniref:Alpha-dioxygenase 1 n=1 Tax=Colletotrichum spinosum TaxID=1347390 RepID=A0A4R8Q5I1_9PEZI|nr:Alpha-dioxygenase 1 [Colletotrichum spinosum]